MKDTEARGDIARVLSRIVVEVSPDATFTALFVARNMDRGQHMDSNNDPLCHNYVLPVRFPERGGDLWVELAGGDVLQGEVCERSEGKSSIWSSD